MLVVFFVIIFLSFKKRMLKKMNKIAVTKRIALSGILRGMLLQMLF